MFRLRSEPESGGAISEREVEDGAQETEQALFIHLRPGGICHWSPPFTLYFVSYRSRCRLWPARAPLPRGLR